MSVSEVGKRRVGVLISGRGSNFKALLAATETPGFPAEIVTVISNRAEAGGLGFAAAAGIPIQVIDHRGYADRQSFDTAVTAALEAQEVDLVAQAGFMRIVSASFIERWWNRLINIHPSLLPAFPGLNTHARALAAGVKLHGCSVHFVREPVDQGPIIGQAAVPVLPGDDPDRLAARVLEAEHRLYPQCLRLVAEGRVTIEGEQCRLDGEANEAEKLFNPIPRPE